MTQQNIKNSTYFSNREELEFFIKNNRFNVRDLLEKSPEFRKNLQEILEGEIIGNKINSSALIQLASNFDGSEIRDPLTNALTINSNDGKSFFNLSINYLKQKIKNPFTKLDEKFINNIRKEEEELEEIELKEKLRKEVNSLKKEDKVQDKNILISTLMEMKDIEKRENAIYQMHMEELKVSALNDLVKNVIKNNDFDDNNLTEKHAEMRGYLIVGAKEGFGKDVDDLVSVNYAGELTRLIVMSEMVYQSNEPEKIKKLEEEIKENNPIVLEALKNLGKDVKYLSTILKGTNDEQMALSKEIINVSKKNNQVNNITSNLRKTNENLKNIDLVMINKYIAPQNFDNKVKSQDSNEEKQEKNKNELSEPDLSKIIQDNNEKSTLKNDTEELNKQIQDENKMKI